MKNLFTLIVFCLAALFTHAQCQNPPVATINYSNNFCGQESCFFVTVTGGVAPYTFNIPNGPTLNPNNYACWDIPGVYVLNVTDSQGCTNMTSFVIQPATQSNDVCGSAVALENNVQLTDTLCAINFENPVCANMQFAQTGWYTFNNTDFTHIQFGAFTPFGSNPGTIQGMGIQILAAENNGTCEEAVEVYCGSITSCFAFEDHFTITPQTNYYVRVMAGWTSWVQINVGVVMDYEPVTGVCGCTNPLSCNYDPEAIINDASCGTNGCTDPSACNYMSWASCDDGSCLFGNDITGVVFHDINGNGTRDTWPQLEPALANAGYITIDDLAITIYPDASGSFVLPGLDLATYTVTFHNTAGNWSVTGGNNTLNITLPTCNGLVIPLTPVSGVAAQVSGTNMFSTSVIQCNNGFNPGVYLQNTGTVPISGTFTLQFDPLFTASNLPYGIGYSSATSGILTWNITNLLPGSVANLITHINGPGVAYVGQSFPFTFDLTLSDGTDVFYTNTWSTNATVSCAYDPNDKQATPEGYTDNHFILAETELQYKIRFQNTGNAPAFDVIIEDQIDINGLDLFSFEPLGASHSYSTIVQPDGLVKFVFNNIMLPDSNMNEPASHGYIIYKIRTLPGVPVGEIINNTASIFFDDNPPIITNTTQHQIYSCDEIPQFNETVQLCYGEQFFQVVDYPYIENITWSINEEVVSNELFFNEDAMFGADWSVGMTIENPLCIVNSQWTIEEQVLPSNVIVYDEIEQTLTATDGVAWQWFYQNGIIIEGATEQTFGLGIEGGYYVEITGSNGCTNQSEVFSFVSVGEHESIGVSVYPNPVQSELRFIVDPSLVNSHYIVFDITGREVFRGKITSASSTIDFSNQSSGSYVLRVGNEIVSFLVAP